MTVPRVDRLRTRPGGNYRAAVAVTHRKTREQSHHLYKHRRQQSTLLRRLLPLCCEGCHPRRARRRRARRVFPRDFPVDMDASDEVLRRISPVHGELSQGNPDDIRHRTPL